MQSPYIGVTGFMTKAEVVATTEMFDRLVTGEHKLMVGVLASRKTLAGQKNKRPNRYPDPLDIASLFTPHRRTVNLIHYATDDRDTLADQLHELVDLGGPWIDGFQLNVRWPDPAALEALSEMRVVLQLGPGALAEEGNDPVAVARRVYVYRNVITDVLVDTSGGRGIPIDPATASRYVTEINQRDHRLGVGVAGGLSGQTVGGLKGHFFSSLSIDAEGRLRDAEDHLDLEAVRGYLAAAAELFA